MSAYNLKPDACQDTRFAEFLSGLECWNIYGQNGEEAILKAVFERIGVTNRWCLEAGAADGLFFSNTRLLLDEGWTAILVEPDEGDFAKLRARFADNERVRLRQQWLVAQPRATNEITLDGLLAECAAPLDLDLVVLDVDSHEYFILNGMVKYRPRVVVVEYNPQAEPMFIPELRGPGQAGHLAMRYVAEARGYDVLCRTATNLICVRRDLSPLLMDSTKLPMRRAGVEILSVEQWEQETNEFLRQARGVVHVGAHEGQERDMYAELGLSVLWIEALPQAVKVLRDRLAGYPSQRVMQYLLTDRDGEAYDFHVASNDGQSSSVFDLARHKEIWPAVHYVGTEHLRSTTFAAMVKREGFDPDRYDALILDVQGAELLVLRGAERYLSGFRWIRCEAADCDLYAGGCQLRDLDAFLLPRGFQRVKTWRASGNAAVGYTYEVLYEQRPAEAAAPPDDTWSGGAYPLAFTDSSQDELSVTGTLEQLPRTLVASALAEWLRVLRPGGWLKLAVPDFEWWVRQFQAGNGAELPLEERLLGDGRPTRSLFTPERLHGLLRQAGFVALQPWRDDDRPTERGLLCLKARKPVVAADTQIRIAAVLSAPRIGYLAPFHEMSAALHRARIPFNIGWGVFWHHSLSRGIQRALTEMDAEGNRFSYILTLDYDSYFTFEMIGQLVAGLVDNPEYDALVPLQAKRCEDTLLAGHDDGRDLTQAVVPIAQGHFGLTLFRREVFERVPRPWFQEEADADGHWGAGRTDADIGFWRNCASAGVRVGLATQIVVGHGEEVVSWPRLVNGRYTTVRQSLTEWQNTHRPPPEVGVLTE